MNFQHSIMQNIKSLEVLKKLYNNEVTINQKGIIMIDNKYITINNKKMLIHNNSTLLLRRNFSKEYEFLNFVENYHQRKFIIDKFCRENNTYFKIENSPNGYNIYSIIDENTNSIKLSLKSKVNSDKKIIALIMLYYGIISKERRVNN